MIYFFFAIIIYEGGIMEEKRIANSLYHAYKRIYGKHPDLMGDQKELTIEFQTMVYFLSQYGVSFMRFGFVYEGRTDIDMPMSLEIQDILVAHMFGHEASEFEEEVEFNKHANNVMNILARELGYLKAPWGLMVITRLHFIENRVLPSGELSDICAEAKIQEGVYKSYRVFLANILCELSKDNYDETNLESIRRQIEDGVGPDDKAYRPILDESGNGLKPNITEESRKIAAKALIR